MSVYGVYKPHIPERRPGMVLYEIFRGQRCRGENFNVAVLAYVTTRAQLKVYEYLRKLGRSVLHSDTDSFIFIQKDNNPKIQRRNYLFDLTDELEE